MACCERDGSYAARSEGEDVPSAHSGETLAGCQRCTFNFAQNTFRNVQNKKPASTIDAGSVNTHAMARLRTVLHCKPE
jgi:hypothetical protein